MLKSINSLIKNEKKNLEESMTIIQKPLDDVDKQITKLRQIKNDLEQEKHEILRKNKINNTIDSIYKILFEIEKEIFCSTNLLDVICFIVTEYCIELYTVMGKSDFRFSDMTCNHFEFNFNKKGIMIFTSLITITDLYTYLDKSDEGYTDTSFKFEIKICTKTINKLNLGQSRFILICKHIDLNYNEYFITAKHIILHLSKLEKNNTCFNLNWIFIPFCLF